MCRQALAIAPGLAVLGNRAPPRMWRGAGAVQGRLLFPILSDLPCKLVFKGGEVDRIGGGSSGLSGGNVARPPSVTRRDGATMVIRP